MREELIRVENGLLPQEDEFYRFEISISRGECIGVYVDDHFTSGTAYLDLFKGGTHLERGRPFPAAVGWARWNWNAGSCKTPGS